MIRLEQVSKSFDGGKSLAVSEVSLEIREGETLILLGASGCGKTTTLKMINRLIEPTSGRIYVNDEDILSQKPTMLRRNIGYVFQGIGLFPHMTILENVAIVPRLLGWSREKRNKKARELLELVNLSPDRFASRYPSELSGGQQQRVGVARALAAEPSIMLMDEPFGALDNVNRSAMQEELLALKEKLRKTIVFVTHDIFEALTLADRIAVMRAGKIEQLGTKEELVQSPATEFVRDLFSASKDQAKALQELG